MLHLAISDTYWPRVFICFFFSHCVYHALFSIHKIPLRESCIFDQFSACQKVQASARKVVNNDFCFLDFQVTNGELAMPFRECGYVLCNVSDAFTNETTHLWDYYVE